MRPGSMLPLVHQRLLDRAGHAGVKLRPRKAVLPSQISGFLNTDTGSFFFRHPASHRTTLRSHRLQQDVLELPTHGNPSETRI